jgi:hypothetical protein
MPLDTGARYRSAEFDDSRAAERWTEKLEAWANRFATSRHDKPELERLALDIEAECGQCDAWDAIALSSWRAWDDKLATAARDAILAIEMPEDTDD